MRKLNVLMCTLLFVCMSACQDQSGLVQEMYPQHVIPGATEARLAGDHHLLQSLGTEQQLIESFEQILSATILQLGMLTEEQVEALANGSGPDIDLFLEQLSQLPGMDTLLNDLNAQIQDVVDEQGETYTLNLLQSIATSFMENIIMTDDTSLVDFDRNECFDALQIDQLAAYTAFAACIATTWETLAGPFICVAVLGATTFRNLKKFKDCVGRKSAY